ncbi:carbamoyltransferase [Methylobacterium sp. J-070]|uniref:carbamoyltransferase family protein n=1 Tax=Methylobacterium sp. J-070 TaxID=2836650 RepID=UPI001FBA2BDF|nr:carbamoyltransferase [Methylobacterium sp. J-070]MCJ2054462.1 carbamoyltransferase [Methylobacterium sp. J-070]
MTVTVLGISAYYHDSAAALVRDGEIIAAAQEERFSRKKHDPRFPHRAIDFCLSEAFIDPSELDGVVFYDNSMHTLDRAVKSAATVAPAGRDQFVAAMRALLGPKARLALDLESALGELPRLLGTQHHLAHAASSYFPSPFGEAGILTIDGVGEWATCTLGVGKGVDIDLLQELRYPHSLGLLYSAFTYHCGFKVNSGEYKLMGLAPYGEPRFAKTIRDKLVDIRDDGSFILNTDALGYVDSGLMTNERFESLFGGPARKPEALITRREMDLAASIQHIAEEIVLKLVKHVKSITRSNNLTMAGGVALNCVANGRVWREAGLDGLYIQPAAGDAGGALGAALLASHKLFGVPRTSSSIRNALKGSLLGPAFSPPEIAAFVDRTDAPNHLVADKDERASIVADALASGKIVGLFNGRMEFGPRALGARSILGDPRDADMQSRMNIKIKFRESFRPFAPAVLAEHAAEYFELEGESPYMLLVAPVRAERRRPLQQELDDDDNMLTIVNRVRSDIPAVTHVDYTARVQTVGEEANPEFRRILRAFHKKTNCPVLINTSFNVRGEPIVCTPQDAFRCFMRTDIDLLVMEDRLLWKAEQPELTEDSEWQTQYELD